MNRNINVFSGDLWAKITPSRNKWTSFETKSGVAGIRGTTVSLSVDDTGSMQFECSEGFVEIATPDGGTIIKMDSGKEIKVKNAPGGKSEITSVKGSVEVVAGNVRATLEEKGAVVVAVKDGKTTVEVPDGSKAVSLAVNGTVVKLDPGAAVSHDPVSGVEALKGQVMVTTADGKTQRLAPGDRPITPTSEPKLAATMKEQPLQQVITIDPDAPESAEPELSRQPEEAPPASPSNP